MTIKIGALLADRYRADALLGRGGMGEVWRCHDLEQARDVAVKSVRRDLMKSPWAVRLFHGEVAAVARLAHPSIVPVYDVCVDAAGTYLVMEYRSGRSLAELVPESPPWAVVRDVLLDVLGALAYAHARGVLHLDIKPENVIVDQDVTSPALGGLDRLRATLVDFGISRIREPGKGVERWLEGSTLVGTLGYLAPERCSGILERFGPWTDLYSVGVMAYELCCGRRPFPDAEAVPALLRRIREPAPPLVPLLPDVPAAFVEICARLLSVEARDRPLRAADVAAAIRACERTSDPAPPESMSSARIPLAVLRAASLMPELDPRAAAGDPTSMYVAAIADDASTTLPLRIAGEAADALSLETPPPPAGAYGLFGLRDVPVLGRAEERGALWAQVSSLLVDRRPRVVVLRGPAGVGKSRIARDAMERAEELGLCIGIQTAWSSEGSEDEGLRALVENVLDCRGATLDRVRARLAVWLERIPGDHRSLVRDVELYLRPPAGAAPDAGLPLWVASEIVTRAAQLRPVILWLEDVQRAQGRAAALVSAIFAAPEEPAVCVIATMSEDEGAGDADLRGLLEREGAVEIRMDRMTPEATRQLVRGLLDVGDELCNMVADRAEGNPLFATELLFQLVHADCLERHRGQYRLARGVELSIPEDIRALWDRRIAQSGATPRHMAALALVRERVSLEVVEHLSSVFGPAFEQSLTRALHAGLCQEQSGAYVWAHGLLREHLVRSISRVDAAELHAVAARVLSPLIGREDVQEERARHLSRAPSRSREACEAMLDAGVWSAARADAGPRRKRLEALIDWAQAADHPDLEARARAELAYAETESGRPEIALAHVAEAHGLCDLGSQSAVRAWVHLRESQVLRLSGRAEEGRRATAEALALARAWGQREVERIALTQQGMDRYRQRDLDEARALFEEAASTARAEGDRAGEAQTLRCLALTESGRAALATALRALTLAREAGALREELVCRQVWVGLLGDVGDLAAARREARALAEEAARRQLRQTVSLLELQSACWAITDSDWSGAREHRNRARTWGAAAGANAERVVLLGVDLVLALQESQHTAAEGIARSLEETRGGYDDDGLRALLARAESLCDGPLALRLKRLREGLQT